MRFLFFFPILLLLNSCETKNQSVNSDNSVSATKGVDATDELYVAENSKICSSLFIIAEDRSGSTSEHRKLSKEDYNNLCEAFYSKYHGQIAVRVIGNPAPNEREFFILNLDQPKKYIEISEEALMSEKGKLRKQNEGIKKENLELYEVNKSKINQFIQDKVEKHVVKYTPHLKKDVTNIEDALKHIETKVNEPTFLDFNKIHILIISDGVHDATKLKMALSFNPNRQVNLFLVGWNNLKIFDKINKKNTFESVDGFITYYKTLTCK